MKPPPLSQTFRNRKPGFSLGKLAALVCSVTLIGGYVMYRSGASSFPGSKSGRVWEKPAEQGVEPAQAVEESAVQSVEQPRMLSSSKWGPVVTPATEPARTMMPGSKAAILTQPVEDIRREFATTQPSSTQPLTIHDGATGD